MKNVAHTAPEAANKKVHTVAKGTLSLAAQHNKRSTDKDALQKEAEQMPQAAEQALAAAAQALHDQATGKGEVGKAPEKQAEVAIEEIPRVVFRADVRGTAFAFWVDTMSLEKDTIIMLDMTHGKEKEEVPLAFYKTLKPMESKQRDKAVAALTEKLGINRIIVRDRLLKSHVLERDTEGKVEAKHVADLEKSLLKAVEQFKQAISAAFANAA